MTTADEATAALTQLAGDLAVGVTTLDLNQVVVFTKYVKVVLPLDGFVFWVKADLLSPSALLNAAVLNSFTPNQGRRVITPAATINARGSLHYATSQNQEEVATFAVNRVVFTSLQEIQDFNQIGPNVLFVAEFDGIRFAFNARSNFYKQANLYHYTGNALYSTMDTQLVDSPAQMSTQLVVSNSLPLWLALNGYNPGFGMFGCPVTLYPSFAVPDNLPPPYGTVHVLPESTQALSAAPLLDQTMGHTQLVRENVRITLYGLRNAEALTFQDCVNQYSLDTDNIGIMNMPTVRDDKKNQTEFVIPAIKKILDFEISY